MENITVHTRFRAGDAGIVSQRVKLRLFLIKTVLRVLDTEGVKARVNLIADTTVNAEDIDLEIVCGDDYFIQMVKECIAYSTACFQPVE